MAEARTNSPEEKGEAVTSIFDIEAIDIDSNTRSLKDFSGKKAYLIINVASKCGFTSVNYTQLYDIYKKYKNDGLEVLAFPSNQFFNQEPMDEPALKTFLLEKYSVEFPLFKKIHVNGKQQHALYKYLGANTPGFAGYIEWNFAKFLVNAQGHPVKYYTHKTNPNEILPDILELIK